MKNSRTELHEIDVVAFYDRFAVEYDQLASSHGWASPEIVFGLLYPALEKDDIVLDMGVGTGLCAELLKENGQKVIGIDASAGMLEVCRRKNVCIQLIKHDLTDAPYPLDTSSCNHVIANGVFYFIYDLSNPFHEVSRVIKRGGTFCFNIECSSLDSGDSYLNDANSAIATTIDSDKAPRVYRHSEAYVSELLQKYGFRLHKSHRYEAYHSPTTNKEVYFQMFLCEKE